jgi:hypothetical protein
VGYPPAVERQLQLTYLVTNPQVKLGVNLPAVARPKRVLAWPHDEFGAPRASVVTHPTPVFLHFGIIDILQVRETTLPPPGIVTQGRPRLAEAS